MTTHDIPDATEAADADLVLRSRSGDADAFGELWRRHYRSGVVVARSVTGAIDPDDLVQEAYARIFQAIRRGGGPSGSFRAYLFTVIRNTAAAWGRAGRDSPIEELDALQDPDSTDEATIAALDRSLTHTAFRSLPTRWQEVLWYTEIEQLKPAQIAPLLGMKPAAVSQLAFRAREGLREAWIQAHLNAVDDGSECQWAIEHLGAHTLGNLGTRNRARLDAHLGDCARCAIVAGEAQEVGSRLALVLLPITIGVSATATYLASLQRDDAAAIALAAMPSGVLEGAVVAGGGVVAGTAGGGSGSSGGSGSAWTIGGLIAAGAAAAAVAGVVVAAALGVFPGGGSPFSPPSASDDSAPPAAAVAAAPELIDDTLPAEPPAEDETPQPRRSDRPAPDASPAPTPTADAAPAPSDEPAPEPSPSATETAQSIEVSKQGAEAALPALTMQHASVSDGDVVLGVAGAPNRDVQVFARSDDATGAGGFSAGVPLAVMMASDDALAQTTLDDQGIGTLEFSLTRAQAQADVTIEVVYADGTGLISQPLSAIWDVRDLLLEGDSADTTPPPGDAADAEGEAGSDSEAGSDRDSEAGDAETPPVTAEPEPGAEAPVAPEPEPEPVTEPDNCTSWFSDAADCLVSIRLKKVEPGSTVRIGLADLSLRFNGLGTATVSFDVRDIPVRKDLTDKVVTVAPDGTEQEHGTLGDLLRFR